MRRRDKNAIWLGEGLCLSIVGAISVMLLLLTLASCTATGPGIIAMRPVNLTNCEQRVAWLQGVATASGEELAVCLGAQAYEAERRLLQ